MQASLIGLRHLGHARIPISARLYIGLGWTDGMMLALDQAGAQHSQSPVGADTGGDGAGMLSRFRSRRSISLTFPKLKVCHEASF